MNISESSKNGHTASFTVVIPAEEFAAAVEQAYEDNKEKYEVEGYDVGQAPLSVYREKYGETAFSRRRSAVWLCRPTRKCWRNLMPRWLVSLP